MCTCSAIKPVLIDGPCSVDTSVRFTCCVRLLIAVFDETESVTKETEYDVFFSVRVNLLVLQ